MKQKVTKGSRQSERLQAALPATAQQSIFKGFGLYGSKTIVHVCFLLPLFLTVLSTAAFFTEYYINESLMIAAHFNLKILCL
jgi:hypothetical protein